MDTITTMAADAHFVKGKTLVEDASYTSAAAEFSASAEILEDALIRAYCAKASALEGAELFEDAKLAAEAALRVSPKFAKAWYCKGASLLKSGKRELAKKSFEKAASLESVLSLKMTYMDWASRCDQVEADHESMEIVDVSGGSARMIPYAAIKRGEQQVPAQTTEAPALQTVVPEVPAVPTPPADNTRMEWYQSSSYVSIAIYAKKVIKENSEVLFEKSRIKVRLARPDTVDYVLEKHLYADVDTNDCTWTVSPFKMEIRMKKAVAGAAWKALDKEAEVLSAASKAIAESSKRKEQDEARQHGWDNAANEELKDYKEDDSSMALFRTIYQDSDEDTRRAMMKSYSESGGQVLSTNWDEVKKKKVTYTEPTDPS